MDINCESGLDFFTRVNTTPNLTDIFPELLYDGLKRYTSIRICGTLSSGKTTLLLTIIGKILQKLILLNDDSKIILILTENHKSPCRLYKLLETYITNTSTSSGLEELANIKVKINNHLCKSLIIKLCFNNLQLHT